MTNEATAADSSPKSIILFSDGTGNSSAMLFKTNAWRMYEAVDLGPPAEGKRAQISYYDDGVGTSSFKPLTVLGGAFGWGLQRNVLDIYRYACRNYREGDDIYAFGFSRGAFTVRLVVALIASQGLVRSTSEAELDRKSRQAYRAFRASFLPRRLKWPTRLLRRISAAIRGLRRLNASDASDPAENCQPTIRFIGVWDTVAAYGGPITEITRAIDNWIYPLSMPDYQLDERVECARHALAIDDERDAFHPLLWDEVHEEALLKQDKVKPGRLEQVWFTGMHADVGGGYPDESLSYVSLLWMMEEAERAGLRTLKVVKDRILALASSYGPMHDSRAGVAAYYRYQPRKIAAWLDPVDRTTLSLRDPVITDSHGRARGLLRSVKVHESVINRIATGTDRYAPITLPETIIIVPPQVEGETMPQADSQTSSTAVHTTKATPMVSTETRQRLLDVAAAAARARTTEPIWNYVWWRRLTYFAALTATLLLLALPLFVDSLPPPPLFADGRTWIGGIIRLLTLVLPSVAANWVEVYADNPFYFLLLAAIIWMLLKVGTRLERTLRDRARGVWERATAGHDLPEPPSTFTQAFRNSNGYQRLMQFLKWYVLPNWVVAPLIVLLASWLALAAYAQLSLPFLENGTRLCKPSPQSVEIVAVQRDFFTNQVCSESFGRVVKDQRYMVTFDVVEPWFDASLATSPVGLNAGDFPNVAGYLGGPFRRVIDARYLQPILEIRPDKDQRRWFGRNIQIYPLDVSPVGDSASLYRAEFVPTRDGELFVFSNDAMLQLWGAVDFDYFYTESGSQPKQGNSGNACVTVENVSGDTPVAKPAPSGEVCVSAGLRNRALTQRTGGPNGTVPAPPVPAGGQ